MTLSNRAPRDVTSAILAEIAPNAARLKAATNSNLGRALVVAVNVHLLAIGLFWAISYLTFTPPVTPHSGDPIWETFEWPEATPAPPRLTETPPGGGTPTQVPGAGIVTPVPESQADPDATAAHNEDIAVSRVGPVGPTPNAGDGSTDRPGTAPRRQTPITAGTDAPNVPERRAETPVETQPAAPAFVERSEIAPEIVGGFAAFQASIAYPRFEREARNTGRVTVRFIVGTDGVPGTIEVVRSVSPGLDRAAMDAVRAARFTPGIQNGQAVAVRMTLPVSFEIR